VQPLAVLFLTFISLTAASARAPALDPKQLQALPDQAQVRVLGQVTHVDAKGRSLRVQANGLTFTTESQGGVRLPPLRPGDRVFLTGELQPGGRIFLDSIQPVRPLAEVHPLVGTLLSVDRRRRRLTLKSEAGRRIPIIYGSQTTFVRLGRRSRVGELRFGDRLWVDRTGAGRLAGAASRVEVVDAREGRFAEVGEITAVDSARQQLRVRFSGGARTVLCADAVVGASRSASAFGSLKVGQHIRVTGDERRGVIVAVRVKLLPLTLP
jgi:hypothetical protein